MKVYLIGGKARNGKDTLAMYMKEVCEKQGRKACIMHISNYIKHFAMDYFGWDGKEETKPRSLLQKLGTEIIREKMNKPLFFIQRVKEDIEVLHNFYDTIIIADLRLPLEFEELTKAYNQAIKIHIERPSLVSELTEKESKHVTETALNRYNQYDYQIVNETLDKLKQDAEDIINKEEYHEKDD